MANVSMKIIRAIVAGECDAVKLAGMKHPLIKSSTDTIAKALTGSSPIWIHI